jgi:hypothetical protein
VSASRVAGERESKNPFVGENLAGKGILRLAVIRCANSGSLRMTEQNSMDLLRFTTKSFAVRIEEYFSRFPADVAQLVEQSIRNRQVIGSSPIVGSIYSKAPR